MTMSSTTTAVPAQLSRDQTGRLLGQTMGLVAVTAGFFAVGAYLGRDSSGGWAILWYIAAFAALIGMNFAVQRSEQLAVGLLFGFGLLFGLAVAPTIGYTSTLTRRRSGRRAERRRCSSRGSARRVTQHGATCRRSRGSPSGRWSR